MPRDRGGVVKRSVAIAGHRTSVSLEEPFWEALNAIAGERGQALQALIGEIDSLRDGQNLSSALRVFVLTAVQAKPDAATPNPPSADD